MKAFSFVHAADLHLGYSQYGLEARRNDFNRAFQELISKTVELKPDFMIIAGDIFHNARPSNVTLEDAINGFSRLRDAGIPVLTVDGSHDSAPNMITGTIINPLDSAGLVYHLPRHEGACWQKPDSCYVYGIPNYRTMHKTEEELPQFIEKNKPTPDPSLFNIFVFHMLVDLPNVKPPYMEAEITPQMMPEGFNYYAAGHVHKPYMEKFKNGLLVYSGCTETVDYEESEIKKGFYHVQVDETGTANPEFINLESTRRFVVVEEDFSSMLPSKITERAVQLVKDADEDGAVLVPILKGTLPAGANRSEIDIAQVRAAGKKALIVHPILSIRESEVSEEAVRSIFESSFKDLKTKAFEYFLQIFSERYGHEKAERVAHVAVSLIEPLNRKQEEEVKRIVEDLSG